MLLRSSGVAVVSVRLFRVSNLIRTGKFEVVVMQVKLNSKYMHYELYVLTVVNN